MFELWNLPATAFLINFSSDAEAQHAAPLVHHSGCLYAMLELQDGNGTPTHFVIRLHMNAEPSEKISLLYIGVSSVNVHSSA